MKERLLFVEVVESSSWALWWDVSWRGRRWKERKAKLEQLKR